MTPNTVLASDATLCHEFALTRANRPPNRRVLVQSAEFDDRAL